MIRTFVSHASNLKASDELIADMWCVHLNISQATLGATTQRRVRSAILTLARRYRADRVFSMRRLNARFAKYTFVLVVKSLNKNTCGRVFSNKVGFNATYLMVSLTGDSLGYSYR